MARGNSNPYADYNRFYMKLMGVKKGEKRVFFSVEQKVAEKEYAKLPNDEGEISSIAGKLTEIKKDSYVHEDKTINKLIFFMVDPSSAEAYRIEMGYNSISRSIINTLASSTDLSVPFQFRVYNEKVNNRPRVWVGQYTDGPDSDPVRLDWSLDWDSQNELTDVLQTKNADGDVVEEKYDYTKLNNRLFNEVLTGLSISKDVPQANAAPAEGMDPSKQEDKDPMDAINAASAGEKEHTPPSEEEDDDLPF
jgi:hypothetical protein